MYTPSGRLPAVFLLVAFLLWNRVNSSMGGIGSLLNHSIAGTVCPLGGPPPGGPPAGGAPAGAAPGGGPPGDPPGGDWDVTGLALLGPGIELLGDWDVREEQSWPTFSFPAPGHSAQCLQ